MTDTHKEFFEGLAKQMQDKLEETNPRSKSIEKLNGYRSEAVKFLATQLIQYLSPVNHHKYDILEEVTEVVQAVTLTTNRDILKDLKAMLIKNIGEYAE